MNDEERSVVINLTYEEAGEILARCLASNMDDTPTFRAALMRLAWAIEAYEPHNQAA
ncbi:MAG: hypothetical protein KF836_08810 [Fimbriimonadaceae bacterium]|nr:hypothetical protein [Fimbriimonadaceae bacterium]